MTPSVERHPLECEYLVDVQNYELGEKVFFADSPFVSRMIKSTDLIDFAGPNLQVYQVTVSDQKGMVIEGLKKLFLASGHCEERAGTIVKSENADKIGKIKFYWVVPPAKATAWKEKKPKTIKVANRVLKECLDNYVIQRILVMDIDPTMQKM